jgi:hypothetical protein
MAVVLALTWPRPRILGEHTAITSMTVPLIIGAAEDLRRLWERTKLSTKTRPRPNRPARPKREGPACPVSAGTSIKALRHAPSAPATCGGRRSPRSHGVPPTTGLPTRR